MRGEKVATFELFLFIVHLEKIMQATGYALGSIEHVYLLLLLGN